MNFVITVVINTLNDWSIPSTLNHYFELIINSWPFSVLILGIILLFTQKESISHFIAKRMISAGFDGIKGSPLSIQEGLQVLEQQNMNETSVEHEEVLNSNITIGAIEPVSETDILRANIETLNQQLNFEKIHNFIFGTQIAILGSMRKDILGINYNVIASVYESWRENDEVLKSYALDDYLSFLTSNNLIELTDRNNERAYRITTKGVDFLGYIEKNIVSYHKEH